MPRQVVLNLEFVRHLNAQAIGVVLAHHLRLDRAGGALRLCQTPARVMAVSASGPADHAWWNATRRSTKPSWRPGRFTAK